MKEKIRVCVIANSGIGGAEKAATLYAASLVARGYAVDYWGDGGPRESYLQSHGVQILRGERSDHSLRAYIEQARPQVLHHHVPGYPTANPLYPALAVMPGEIKPKVLETNVFGRLEDPESAKVVDFRFFISAASAAQAFRRAGVKPNSETLQRQTVLYYPVLRPNDSISTIDASARRAFRGELDVGENEILAVRVGRPSHKWAAWECEAYTLAKRTAPQLRLFLMEPPRNLMKKITDGRFGTGIIVRNETSDFAWLEKLYASADLMIHASDWGESFGYTIAEGMAAELPVITRSTPWCDNAQVELVKNSETGFVCWSVPEMTRCLIELASDEKMRHEMGVAAQRRILSLANPEHEADLLEAAVSLCLRGETSPVLVDRNAQLLRFIKEFAELERTTSESYSQHPADFVTASIYSFYRGTRANLRSILNRWQRRRKTVPA